MIIIYYNIPIVNKSWYVLALDFLYNFSSFGDINPMDFYAGKKKLISYLPSAFVLASISRLMLFLLSLLPIDSRYEISDLMTIPLGVLFSGMASFFVLSRVKKSLFVAFAVTFSSVLLYSFTGMGYSIVVCIFLSVIFSLVVEKYSTTYSYIIIVLSSVLLSVALGVAYPVLYDGLGALCSFVSGKGAMFGAVNEVYSALVSDNLSSLIYHTDYSSAQLVNDEIISGVVDIFEANMTPTTLVAKYLGGKYFVSVFLSIGVGVALFSRLDDRLRVALILVCFTAIITGDTILVSTLLLCYNPFLYVGYVVCVLLSYFMARFVDIRIGFVRNGDIIELFKYGEKWVYFFLIGAVLSVLLYFVFQLIFSRFDFDNHKVLPKEVRRIILSLGGERNIERVNNGKVYVVNPNLIDILRLDCDIHENEISLLDDDYDLLQKYF